MAWLAGLAAGNLWLISAPLAGLEDGRWPLDHEALQRDLLATIVGAIAGRGSGRIFSLRCCASAGGTILDIAGRFIHRFHDRLSPWPKPSPAAAGSIVTSATPM